jgi:pimeloyl-ACP methyl ester carboxylesterase
MRLALAKTEQEMENDTMTAVENPTRTQYPVHYKTVRVNDLDIFYREAGPEGAPVILLLHGFPTSSNMFRNLIPRLAGSFRLVAPDYPGYGQSSMPDHSAFEYTFENYAKVIAAFVEAIGLTAYSMYVMDYGAPVGYRLALLHPERVQALILFRIRSRCRPVLLPNPSTLTMLSSSSTRRGRNRQSATRSFL